MSRKSTAIANEVHTRIYVTCIRRLYMIMHTYAKLNLPRVTSLRLLPNFCQRQHSPERLLPLYSQADTIWRVSSCISFVNYFSRESISRHLSSPFVHPSYLLPYPILANAALKYLCAQIPDCRARSNRSHRTRERRGPINIKPPDQIAFRLKKRGKKMREQNTKILSF